MFRLHLWLTMLLASALLTLKSIAAVAAPVVFDFEDGLQGWELHGSAARVQTQLLGGQWGIFGDGFSQDETTSLPLDVFISREIDLTDIASVSTEQFFLDGEQEGLFVIPDFHIGIDLIGELIIIEVPGFGPFEPSDSPANPSVRTARMIAVDGERPEGVHRVEIHWNLVPQRQLGEELPAIVAFIDNVIFHPVPEPASWLSLSLGISGATLIRSRLRRVNHCP